MAWRRWKAGVGVLGLAAGLLACCLAPAVPAQATVLPSGFQDNVVFSGLEEPMSVSFASDGRVFVAEKAGKIMVYENLADDTPQVFADLRTEVYDIGDRGIMGLELDPGFPASPYVYVLYAYDHLLGEAAPPPKWGQPDDTGDTCPKPPEVTDPNACPVSGRIVRLTAGGVGGNEAIAEKPLVEGWCQQYNSHSVGDLQFDSSGALYASGGEGANAVSPDFGQNGWPNKNQCGDPPAGIGGTQTMPTAEGGAFRSLDAYTPSDPLNPSADPTGLNGSVIRVDPDTGQGLPGNPMFGSLDANERRIVGYGFRNPFRFAIDQEDEIYVGNVGWVEFEEIDRFGVDPDSAFNSGWPCYEGPAPNIPFNNLDSDLCADLYADPGAVSPSLFAYATGGTVYPGDPCSSENGSAITGMNLYEAGAYPAAYDGALFFADSVRGCIYVMQVGENGDLDPGTTTVFASEPASEFYPAIDLEVGPGGDLYYVRLFGDEEGAIHRISYDPGAPIAHLKASPTFGAADPLVVDLDATESTDPDGETLSFEWDLDGNGTFEETEAGAELTETIDGPNKRRIMVKVVDEGGASSVAQVIVHPGNTPPEPEIEEPLASLEWSVGETIEFAGSAEDPQDGELSGEDLHWRVRIHHCPDACHKHPLQVFPGVEEGSFVAPDHDYPSKLEVILTATDSNGLSASAEPIVIEPKAVNLDIASNPAGLTLGAGLKSQAAPFTLTMIKGSNVVLTAPLSQELGGSIYIWNCWSDGGARVHDVAASQPALYTAFYARDGAQAAGCSGSGSPSGSGAQTSTEPPPVPGAPESRLQRHPARKTRKSTARFHFSANTADAAFRCKLDGRKFASCRSPKVYKNLAPGKHAFRVAAVSPGGTADPTPALFRWTVLPDRDRDDRKARRITFGRAPVSGRESGYSDATWVCHLGRIGRSWRSTIAARAVSISSEYQ